MKVKTLFSLATVAGLWASGAMAVSPPSISKAAKNPAPVAEEMSAAEANQALADSVARTLKSAGVTQGANLNIVCIDGVVELTGTVTSENQRLDVLKTVQTVSGVGRIRDGLQVVNLMPTGGQVIENMPVMRGGHHGGVVVDPAPVAAPGAVGFEVNGPKMPHYAWPTYAPYNNFSRVATPEYYPYQAFPFIGPFYPFPKVPLGWRAVKLQWEDGHWYYGRIATSHDYWRVRFW